MKKIGFIVLVLIFSSQAYSAECKTTQQAIEALKSRLSRNGAPKIDGEAILAEQKVPSLMFGRVKLTMNYDAVDEIKTKCGGTATVFVKKDKEFIRVSTNVLKDNVRAVGTSLAKNKAYESVIKGEAFCGEVEILGKPYDTCYEPIKSGNEILGLYYVGYQK